MAVSRFDIFLKLDGIEGESTDKKHPKEIIVLSYEQSVEHPGAPSGHGGVGATAARFTGVRFRKPIDKSSVPLLLACASGQHIKSAVFTFKRAGPGGGDFYKVSLMDVTVTAVTQTAGTGVQYPLSFKSLDAGADGSGLLDEVTFDYRKIAWEYTPTGSGGRPLPPVKGGWDITTNQRA
jgi:type VI secretion system secreted protein Hcp